MSNERERDEESAEISWRCESGVPSIAVVTPVGTLRHEILILHTDRDGFGIIVWNVFQEREHQLTVLYSSQSDSAKRRTCISIYQRPHSMRNLIFFPLHFYIDSRLLLEWGKTKKLSL